MSPASPHFLNQAPPRAQQLGLPDFLLAPHLGHAALMAVEAGMATGGALGSDRADLDTAWYYDHMKYMVHIESFAPAIAANGNIK